MDEAITETSAGVVVYRDGPGGEREFLLLQNPQGSWEFPKGKLEGGETPREAAVRELREESGLTDVALDEGFARQIGYTFRGWGRRRRGRLVEKTVHFLLGRTNAEDAAVRLSREHKAFAFLPFPTAVQRLSHAGTRAVLRDAVAFLAGEPTAASKGG